MSKATKKKAGGRKITLRREIHAPCHLVYEAWTNPKLMEQWFSPEDVECKSVSAQVKVGGKYRIHMKSKEGDHVALGHYTEVIPNQRLQFTWQWEAHAMPDSVITVSFEDLGKTTRLTFVHDGFPDQEDSNDHKKGWTSALEKFARMMKKGQITPPTKAGKDYKGEEFVIRREFDAPRELVFQAWTDAKHLAQWWGPRGFTNPVCQWDACAGETIHVVMRAPNGAEFPMGGQFREVSAPERLVFTSGALDADGNLLFEFIHTVVLTAKKGKTLLTIRSKVTQTTPGAGKYIGGFEAGMTQSLEKLSEHLATSAPVIVERTLNSPAPRVWKALTDKEDMLHWYFPLDEFKAEVGFEFDFTVEHKGFIYKHLCRITEVVPGKKLVHTWRYAGHKGDSLVTFELFAEGSKTRVKLTHEGLNTFPEVPAFAKANFAQGWNQLLGVCLKEFVENKTADREILVARVVDAPRELVWSAMTEPKHVVHWWGPRGFTDTIEVMDVRPGGTWKHVMHGPDGTDYANKSIFKEVVKPERIVFSHGGAKKGGPGVNFVATWSFEEVFPNQTKVTIRMVFPTTTARDVVVKSYGALEGARQTLARLSEYLPKMGGQKRRKKVS